MAQYVHLYDQEQRRARRDQPQMARTAGGRFARVLTQATAPNLQKEERSNAYCASQAWPQRPRSLVAVRRGALRGFAANEIGVEVSIRLLRLRDARDEVVDSRIERGIIA